jgi:hypothetical protein
MRKLARVSLAVAAFFILGACSLQETKPVIAPVKADIPTRIEGQQKRIKSGEASKAITVDAARVLRENLERIRARHARLSAEGKLTPAEIQSIEHALDLNSDMIYRKAKYPERLD